MITIIFPLLSVVLVKYVYNKVNEVFQFSSTVPHKRFTFHSFSQSPSETWSNAIYTQYFVFSDYSGRSSRFDSTFAYTMYVIQ